MTASTARKLYLGLFSLLMFGVIVCLVTDINLLAMSLHPRSNVATAGQIWNIVLHLIYGATIVGAMFLASKLAKWILLALLGTVSIAGLALQILNLHDRYLAICRAASCWFAPSPVDAIQSFNLLHHFSLYSPFTANALWVIGSITNLLIIAACMVILFKQMPTGHRGASTATPSPTNGPTQTAPIDRRNSGMAIASLVFGLLSLLSSFAGIGLLFGVLALTFGLTAKKHIRTTPGLTGSGMATAGVVLGAIALAVGIVALVIFGGAVFSFLHLMQ
ncbi:DUF4190 domain-containing protein [Oleiagrimonas soli]|uniref:DUF4190 domain-containing protein n=1 Tax=Oleiagrimonas soli TaxID=1543381 RepID=A0A841KHZ7_9GAMM|nr:DUF4190 domain-containing protein [Oleiagrimonas soli]MBB6185253.1 hypothetical protein [Oleiagrimonas soli]